MFNLDTSLAAWRSTIAHRRVLLGEDLDELEQHVRDQVQHLLKRGWTEEDAFNEAMRLMGEADVTASAYQQVYWGKLRRNRTLLSTLIHEAAMLSNYLKIAVRNFNRHRGYAFLNVTGLAVGMACCLLILLYVQHELRYDRHHENADRIVRMTAHFSDDDRQWAPIGPPTGPAVHAAMPEVEAFARVFPFGSDATLRSDDQVFEAPNGVYADSAMFDVFTIPLVRGNPATALDAPRSIVLSETLARRIFGDAEPIDQVLNLSGFMDLTVTGVMEDLPETTHLPFDYMVSMATFYAANEESGWLERARTWAGFYTYLLLNRTEAVDAVRQKIPGFVTDFFGEIDGKPAAEELTYVLQPLPDIHLHSKLEKEYRANSDAIYVYVFAIVALFVLLIACVNFVNLSTARASKRMREVGMRKALGAARGALIRQFLGESMLMVLLALVLAAGLIAASLSTFNQLTGMTLSAGDFAGPSLLLGLGAVTLLTALISGLYPAFVLSGFRPTEALRGHSGSARHTGRLRRGLVVFQFAISIFLIASTLVVFEQLSYFQNRPLGFDKEQVVNVRLSGPLVPVVRESLESVREELMRHPAVVSVSMAADYPGERYSLENFTVEGGQEEATMMRVAWGVDHDYARTLRLEFAAGRDFSREAPADTTAWLLNEAAVRRLGLTEPLGQVLNWGSNYSGPVVGVVKDFHFASLHHQIEPLVIPLRPGVGGTLLVRVEAGQARQALDYVENQLVAMAPGSVFRYTFLDDEFDRHYASEARLGDLFTTFSFLAIIIACLGLFGLAAFTAEQRTKEIGVRKVLGATVPGLVRLLSKDFLRLVAVAFVVAAPLSYFAMQRWLESFAFRVELSWGIFLIAGVAALGIALLTVSYQAVRAAMGNPVKALRYE